MSNINRRDFGFALAAFSATADAQSPATGTLGKTRIFLPQLTKQPNGSERWRILKGTLNTGEAVGMHESVVPAGTPASAPHKILHSELLFLVEGALELWADGEVSQATAGSVLYVANGTNHFVRNVGEGPARYVVWQMGGDTK